MCFLGVYNRLREGEKTYFQLLSIAPISNQPVRIIGKLPVPTDSMKILYSLPLTQLS